MKGLKGRQGDKPGRSGVSNYRLGLDPSQYTSVVTLIHKIQKKRHSIGF